MVPYANYLFLVVSFMFFLVLLFLNLYWFRCTCLIIQVLFDLFAVSFHCAFCYLLNKLLSVR